VTVLDVSIVIVNWNTRDLLSKCLSSVIKEVVGFQYEVFVIDNNSSDGSARTVHEQFKDVHVIELPSNSGFGRANNVGIAISSGRYVCLINSDVLVGRGCLQRLVHYLDENVTVGIVGPKVLNSDGSIQKSWGVYPTLSNAIREVVFLPRSRRCLLNGSIPIRVQYVSGCFMLMRSAALSEVGGFDERFFFYGEDVDLCRRFSNAGWLVYLLPKAEIVHYGGASSSKAPVAYYLQQVRARLQYWGKHGAVSSRLPYLIVLISHQIVRICVNAVAASLVQRYSRLGSYNTRRSRKAVRFLFSREAIGILNRLRDDT